MRIAIGRIWALLPTELVPKRAGLILLRGIVYGDQLKIYDAHRHSDVVEGRTVGAGVAARLRPGPLFARTSRQVPSWPSYAHGTRSHWAIVSLTLSRAPSEMHSGSQPCIETEGKTT